MVLTYGYWQRAFGGQESVIGQSLRVNGVSMPIVGVLPPGFRFIDPDIRLMRAVAFTRGGASRRAAPQQQLAADRPAEGRRDGRAGAEPAHGHQRHEREAFPAAGGRSSQRALHDRSHAASRTSWSATSGGRCTLLWGGVLVVLVIGCVNVTNLVLVRSTARMRELATRHALGAGFAPSGAPELHRERDGRGTRRVAGLMLGWWALASAPVLGIDQLPRRREIGDRCSSGAASPSRSIAGVGAVMAALPIGALRRTNLAQVVREEGRSGTATRRSRLIRRALVTSQVAFALMLLIGAGVMVASLQKVLAIDPGFRGRGRAHGSDQPAAGRATPRSPSCGTLMAATAGGGPGAPRGRGRGLSSTIPFSGSTSDSVILAEGYQMAPGESLDLAQLGVGDRRLLRDDGRAADRGPLLRRRRHRGRRRVHHHRRSAGAEVLARRRRGRQAHVPARQCAERHPRCPA